MESPRGLKEAHIHCANCRACLSLRQQSVQWAHGLVGHGDAPVLSEGCEPLISRQDVPLRYRVGCVASRSPTPNILGLRLWVSQARAWRDFKSEWWPGLGPLRFAWVRKSHRCSGARCPVAAVRRIGAHGAHRCAGENEAALQLTPSGSTVGIHRMNHCSNSIAKSRPTVLPLLSLLCSPFSLQCRPT